VLEDVAENDCVELLLRVKLLEEGALDGGLWKALPKALTKLLGAVYYRQIGKCDAENFGHQAFGRSQLQTTARTPVPSKQLG
jgi:hypothetical protein